MYTKYSIHKLDEIFSVQRSVYLIGVGGISMSSLAHIALSMNMRVGGYDRTPSHLTKKLENDGYIERTLGQDTRYNEIKITEKGRELLDRTHELFLRVDSAMLEGFSAEELDSYIAYLERMQKNIQKQTKEHIQ